MKKKKYRTIDHIINIMLFYRAYRAKHYDINYYIMIMIMKHLTVRLGYRYGEKISVQYRFTKKKLNNKYLDLN